MNKFEWSAQVADDMAVLRSEGKSWQYILDDLQERGVKGAMELTNKKLRSGFSYHKPDEFEGDEIRTDAVVKMHTARMGAARDRQTTKAMAQHVKGMSDISSVISDAVAKCSKFRPAKVRKGRKVKGTPITMEILFSDLQIGKLMPGYNTAIAKDKMKFYGEELQRLIQYKEKVEGYKVERIIFAMMGDIIESDEKHSNSAQACDSSTSAQMTDAITCIWKDVLLPLGELGVPMDVVCITGNHDWNGNGLNMFKPGVTQLSWPMYKSFELMSEAANLEHVNYHIPEGTFSILDIYGDIACYEHGVKVGANPGSMDKQRMVRSKQIRKSIVMYRMGDKHHYCNFNNGALIINGAFFGDNRDATEYSGISGYDGEPAQVVVFHKQRETDYLSTGFDTKVIQLGEMGFEDRADGY